MQVKAHAKLNLALAVGPARDDGMHPIASWMTPISLADELEVTRLEADRFSRYAILWHEEALRPTEIGWSITKDLAVRAHLLLEAEVGCSLPVQLKMEKRTPVGAGLGGGSADAAAMMRAVRELYDLDVDDARMRALAMELGSDVAFCLGAGAAVVEGIGETIAWLPSPDGAVVLVCPDFGCHTGSVYDAFDGIGGGALRADDVRAMASAGMIDSASLFNDLAAAAETVSPALREIRDEVSAIAEAPAHVTGSGSAMFVYCEGGDDHAVLLRDALRGQLEDCAVEAVLLGSGAAI